jgi:hypothetical protein
VLEAGIEPLIWVQFRRIAGKIEDPIDHAMIFRDLDGVWHYSITESNDVIA